MNVHIIVYGTCLLSCTGHSMSGDLIRTVSSNQRRTNVKVGPCCLLPPTHLHTPPPFTKAPKINSHRSPICNYELTGAAQAHK